MKHDAAQSLVTYQQIAAVSDEIKIPVWHTEIF